MALVYDIRKDIRFQQGREEERERAAQQTAEQLQQEKRIMARGMKQEGIAVEVIARVSGLSEEEVNEL